MRKEKEITPSCDKVVTDYNRDDTCVRELDQPQDPEEFNGECLETFLVLFFCLPVLNQ